MKKTFSLLILSIFIIIFYLIPIFTLEVRVNESEELVFQQKANIGEYFDVQWIHSVTLQPVIETYRLIAPGNIPIIKMVFDEFGPNLPAQPEGNQYWIIDNGEFTVMGYERIFERVPVTIGAVIADHTLIYNGKKTPLKDVYMPGGYVHIGLQKKTLGQFLIEEVEIWLKGKMKIIS